MTANRPNTPLHPGADQEINIPGQTIPKELTSALDLGDEDENDDAVVVNDTLGINSTNDNDDVDMDDNENAIDDDDISDASLPVEDPLSTQPIDKGHRSFSDCSGFFDTDIGPRKTPVNPFGRNTNLGSSEPIRIVRRKSLGDAKPRRLSMSQQSRLVNYIDSKLMSIQRSFIKYLSARDDEASKNDPTIVKFGLNELLAALDNVVDIIWYSIFKAKNVPFVYHYDVLTSAERQKLGQNGCKEVELEEITSDFLFGQTSYLIRIMGDFVDNLEKLHLRSFEEVHNLLVFLAKLDNIISILIDEYTDTDEDMIGKEEKLDTTSSEKQFISNTEKIRIDAIINRTKILVIHMFDQLKGVVLDSLDHPQEDGEGGKKRKRSDELKAQVDNYELLIGEIYEGILDRTSI